jgi:hypothetical protein
MDGNPFPKFIADAAQIRTSGRVEAFATTLKRLANTSGPNGWYVELLAGLCGNATSELSLLTKAYEGKLDPPLLAWRARNLLELSAWSIYCEANKENARRLYEDAGRDVKEIHDLFHDWGTDTEQDASFFVSIAKSDADLAARAASEGIKTLEGQYKAVHEAARETKYRDFKIGFKLLSKFAHPTAMQIVGLSNAEQTTTQRDQFFGMGCLYFTGAFYALENCLHKFDA